MPEGLISWKNLQQDFFDQKAAMIWHATGNLAWIKDAAEFDLGIAKLPAGRREGAPIGASSLYIFKHITEREKAAAFKLVKYLTSPQLSASWSAATGYLAVSPEAYETDLLQDFIQKNPSAATVRDQLATAAAPLSTHRPDEVNVILEEAIHAVLQGQSSAQSALSQAQRLSDQVLLPFR